MPEYFHWFFVSVDSLYISSALQLAVSLARGSNLIFWYLILVLVRYQLPDFILWLTYLVNPRSFDPPPLRQYAAAKPLVSVVIAGRNPGYSIVTCIQSVLNCNYKNVEVIFADDHSTDNSVELARAFERTGRVRVFSNANHSGKPANLNVAIMFARGEFLFALDADSQVELETINRILPLFEDPRVGAVSPGILVRNPTATLLTRYQEIEYVLTYVINQLWRDRLNLISIQSGMGTMLRTSAVRSLGGYDMGLGDDTDLTIRLRKTGWRLRASLTGRISTDGCLTWKHLLKQRSRWTRNMVKMRLRKHVDMATFRYGALNAIVFYDVLFNRVLHPLLVVGLVMYAHFIRDADTAVIIGGLYWFTTIALLVKVLMAHDMTRGDPGFRSLLVIPIYIFYRIPLFLNQATQVTRELLKIKPWHPYVPRRIWDQIPHH